MPQAHSVRLCDCCVQLPLSQATTEPHEKLRLLGQHPHNPDGSVDTQYRCLRCETHWLLRVNRWGISEGFRLKPS